MSGNTHTTFLVKGEVGHLGQELGEKAIGSLLTAVPAA